MLRKIFQFSSSTDGDEVSYKVFQQTHKELRQTQMLAIEKLFRLVQMLDYQTSLTRQSCIQSRWGTAIA